MTFRSVPWTSQPPAGTRVSHTGVVFCVSGTDASKDLVSGKIATGTTLTKTVGKAGIESAGTTSFLSFGRTDADTVGESGTLIYVGRGVSLPVTGVSCSFFSSEEATTGNGFIAAIENQYYITNGYIILANHGTTIRNSGSNVIGSTIAVNTVVITWAGANLQFYVNGRLVNTVSNWVVPLQNAARVTRLGYHESAGVQNHADTLIAVLARNVSRSEGCSLSANPYQIFQPRKLPIFVDIPVDHNIYAYTDESATTNETSEYPSTGSVFNEVSQDTNSSAESSSVLVNLNAASIEPSTSQESSTSQAALQAARVESNASQESSTSQATLQSVLTESNASQDTQTQGATSSNTTTDTNSVTDSSIKVYTAQTTLNDTNSVVANQTAQAQLYAARSEVNNAVESISALAQLYAAKTESFAATETSTQGASSSNNTTDSIGVTDSSTKAYIAQATLLDSNTSTDGSTVRAQFYAAKTEAATTLDSLLAQASLLAVKLETASPTDSRNTSTTFVAAQLNTINIIDTYAAIASLTAQLHTISNSIEVLLGNSISSANTLEITTALDDFYALLEQLIYQLSQVVFMNETLAFTLIPISRTTSLRAETRRNTAFNSSIRLNQFLATKPITTYIRT